MSATEQSATPNQRPLGVWILTAVNFLIGFIAFVLYTPEHLFPAPPLVLPSSATFDWLWLGLLLALCSAAYGTWAGSRASRNILLCLITLFFAPWILEVGAFLYEGYREWNFRPEGAAFEAVFWQVVFLLSVSAMFIGWSAVNWRYLLSHHARAFSLRDHRAKLDHERSESLSSQLFWRLWW